MNTSPNRAGSSSRRPFRVLHSECSQPFGTESRAKSQARVLANRHGRPIGIRDQDQGRELLVQPAHYQCQICHRPLTRAEFDACRPAGYCCLPEPAFPTDEPMAKRKSHVIPDRGYHRCGSCGMLFHAVEIDPQGNTPCGCSLWDFGCEAVPLHRLTAEVYWTDRQRCEKELVSWVSHASREKLLHPRVSHGRLLTTRPDEEPANALAAQWSMLWYANPRKAAAWLRRLIDERLNAEGHEVAA